MDDTLELTPETVARYRDWIANRADRVVPVINRVREDLGEVFDVDVSRVDEAAYREEVAIVFEEGDRGANLAAMVAFLRMIDVPEDHPGFIMDEIIGRELAGTIAGGQPLQLLAEATFHYADTMVHASAGETAGLDDLDAALAAGFQTRLPGWPWRSEPSPFDDLPS